MNDRIRIQDLRDQTKPDTGDPSQDFVVVTNTELAALLDAVEAAHDALALVAKAITEVPSRDEFGEAHFALEAARLKLNATRRFDFGDA